MEGIRDFLNYTWDLAVIVIVVSWEHCNVDLLMKTNLYRILTFKSHNNKYFALKKKRKNKSIEWLRGKMSCREEKLVEKSTMHNISPLSYSFF